VQLTTLLVETIKSGKLTVSENNVPQLEIKAKDKRIDVNATNKELIKEIISSASSGTNKGIRKRIENTRSQLRTVREARPLVKDIVEDLCKEGVTITLSYKGDKVATIGAEANSKLTRLVSGTKGIEINSPRKLVELGI
jgi:hypothetical protein